MLKYIFTLFALGFLINASAATCTTTSRTNYSTGQVLTSSALNADFNQLVTKSNAFDGGCITDGTLEASALNSTDFGAVTNGTAQGCALTYVDANTIGIGKCMLGVNGSFVKTATQANVTWGCSGCSSEATAAQYYLYAKTGSSGTTLTGLISTTAPGADGYDVSGNKILGKFYNNASSDITRQSIIGYNGYGFGDSSSSMAVYGSNIGGKVFSVAYYGANRTTACSSNPCTYSDVLGTGVVSSVGRSSGGSYTLNLNFAVNRNRTSCWVSSSQSIWGVTLATYSTEASAFGTTIDFFTATTTVLADSYGVITCITE